MALYEWYCRRRGNPAIVGLTRQEAAEATLGLFGARERFKLRIAALAQDRRLKPTATLCATSRVSF